MAAASSTPVVDPLCLRLEAACTIPDKLSSMVIPLDDPDVEGKVRLVALDIVDEWKGTEPSSLAVTKISGGITNLLFRVTHPASSVESVLVRLYGANTELMIDRRRDTAAFRLLSERGVGPRYWGQFPTGRVEGYIKARPLLPEEMGHPAYAPGIGRALAKMHAMDIPAHESMPKEEPCLWKRLYEWMDLVDELSFPEGHEHKATALAAIGHHGGAARMRKELEWLKTVLPLDSDRAVPVTLDAGTMSEEQVRACELASRFASDVVFCHNDLLSGNLIVMSEQDASLDKSAPRDVHLIDFEYGSFNFRGWDWGNHFCEYAGFDFDLDKWYPETDDQKHAFLKAYVAQSNPALVAEVEKLSPAAQHAFWREMCAQGDRFALSAHCWWGLWAVVQSRWSPIDFDFIGYAKLRWDDGYYKQKRQRFPHLGDSDE
jgi:ethanolamine kinase